MFAMISLLKLNSAFYSWNWAVSGSWITWVESTSLHHV